MARILLAGGYGLVGSNVARMLRRAHPDVEIVLAGRNPRDGIDLASELSNCTVAFLDVLNPQAALDQIGDLDLIVAILKDPYEKLFAEAVKRRVAHIGITKTADEVSPQLFAACGDRLRTPVAVLGHWQAGVLAYACADLFAEFDQVNSIELAAVYDPADPIGPMTEGDGEAFFSRALLRRSGRWQWIDPETNGRSIDRFGVSPIDGRPMGVLDVPSLAMASGAADVRFDLAIGESEGTRSGGGASHDLYITVSGRLETGGDGIRHRLVSDTKGQAHMTAMGVLIAIERILGLDGAPAVTKGFHGPESLLPAADAVRRLGDADIEISDLPPVQG